MANISKYHRYYQQMNIPSNDVLVLPAELVADTTDGAVLAARLQPQHTESLGNDHALLLVIWGRNTLEGLEALHSSGTASGLVRDHTTDGSPEDLRWGTEVEGTWCVTVSTIAELSSHPQVWWPCLCICGLG